MGSSTSTYPTRIRGRTASVPRRASSLARLHWRVGAVLAVGGPGAPVGHVRASVAPCDYLARSQYGSRGALLSASLVRRFAIARMTVAAA